MEVKDKVAIVTGASEGIGLAVSEYLAKAGANVVLAARSKNKIDKAAEELPNAIAIATDMTKKSDIANLIKQTQAKYGRIDLLINNAGRGLYGPLETINMDEFREVMELNVFSVVEAIQQVIPIMRKQGHGMILNISSRVSKNYFPRLSAYAATKYALNCLTLTAREELAPDGIIVSLFHPKMTATRFGVNAIGGSKEDSRATGVRAPGVDTAEDVAEQVLRQIQTEDAEASM